MQYENALALRVALETGLRIGDVLALKPCDINGRTISYTAQKTRKKGKAVISADLAKRLGQISNKDYIFAGRFGNKPRCRQTVWKDVKKASKELKFLENVAPHSARKTFAVDDFHENGLPHTQKQLQHDRTDTTMLYAFSDLLTGKAHKNLDVEKFAELVANKVVEKLRQTVF
ncbi:MAG: tyrosine-type recombinase/integrase [Ruminococcus sp.]|nr:tyrosine-type recombinase/integrase [Ruminococcus sp.]